MATSELPSGDREGPCKTFERRALALDRKLELFATARRSESRWLKGTSLAVLGVTIACWASLLLAMAHGFHWF